MRNKIYFGRYDDNDDDDDNNNNNNNNNNVKNTHFSGL
jgi:hypothetical protein